MGTSIEAGGSKRTPLRTHQNSPLCGKRKNTCTKYVCSDNIYGKHIGEQIKLSALRSAPHSEVVAAGDQWHLRDVAVYRALRWKVWESAVVDPRLQKEKTVAMLRFPSNAETWQSHTFVVRVVNADC